MEKGREGKGKQGEEDEKELASSRCLLAGQQAALWAWASNRPMGRRALYLERADEQMYMPDST